MRDRERRAELSPARLEGWRRGLCRWCGGKGGRGGEGTCACGGSGEAWRCAAGVTRHVPLCAPRVGLLSPGQPFWFLAWRPPGSGLSRELGEEGGSRLLLARPVPDTNLLCLCRRGTFALTVILALGPSWSYCRSCSNVEAGWTPQGVSRP